MTEPLTAQVNKELEVLLESLEPRVQSLFHAYRIPREESQDLVHEAVVAALRFWPSIVNKESWLLATIRYQCHAYHRYCRRAARYLENVDPEFLLQISGAASTPQSTVDTKRDLHRLLAHLDKKDRQLLALWYGARLGPLRVAALLGYHPKSVRKAAARLLARLRKAAAIASLSRNATRDSL